MAAVVGGFLLAVVVDDDDGAVGDVDLVFEVVRPSSRAASFFMGRRRRRWERWLRWQRRQ